MGLGGVEKILNMVWILLASMYNVIPRNGIPIENSKE